MQYVEQKGGVGSGVRGHTTWSGKRFNVNTGKKETTSIEYKKSGNKEIDAMVMKILDDIGEKAISSATWRKDIKITVSGKLIGKWHDRGIWRRRDTIMGMHKFRSNEITFFSNATRSMFSGKDFKRGIVNVVLHELGHAATRQDNYADMFGGEESKANKWGKKYGKKFGFSW